MALTTQQRLERTRVALLRNPKWQHMAGIFMLGKSTVTDEPITARTDGRDIQYGRAFVDGLTDAQLAGLVLHESFHVMYKQLTVWTRLWDENPELANMAADYVINLPITDAGHELPPGGCVDEKYRGMDTLQVFRQLQQQQQSAGATGGTGQAQPGGGFDEHDWQNAKALGKEEREQLAKEIDQALREGAILAGRNGGDASRLLGELLAPQVDWRDVMREFIQTSVKGNEYATWRKPNRRHLAADMYLPSQLSDTMGHVVVGVDTSGSISPQDLTAYLSEISSICTGVQPDSLDLLYWDAHIAGHESYEGEQCMNIVHSTQPKGGGGTDVRVVMDYVQRKKWTPQCAVILTDGYTPWPSSAPPYPVLWVITTDVIAPFGTTIRIRV